MHKNLVSATPNVERQPKLLDPRGPEERINVVKPTMALTTKGKLRNKPSVPLEDQSPKHTNIQDLFSGLVSETNDAEPIVEDTHAHTISDGEQDLRAGDITP